MAHMLPTRPATGPVSTGPVLISSDAPTNLVAKLFSVWRERQHLARLDPHLRRDIGLTDAQIHGEVVRPVWDVPSTWRY